MLPEVHYKHIVTAFGALVELLQQVESPDAGAQYIRACDILLPILKQLEVIVKMRAAESELLNHAVLKLTTGDLERR